MRVTAAALALLLGGCTLLFQETLAEQEDGAPDNRIDAALLFDGPSVDSDLGAEDGSSPDAAPPDAVSPDAEPATIDFSFLVACGSPPCQCQIGVLPSGPVINNSGKCDIAVDSGVTVHLVAPCGTVTWAPNMTCAAGNSCDFVVSAQLTTVSAGCDGQAPPAPPA